MWHFLRLFDLPYCSLYDDGYTSLGKRSDTAPNPALLKPDGSYAPAWELSEELLERAGRDAKLQLPLHPAEAAAARGEPIEARTAALLEAGQGAAIGLNQLIRACSQPLERGRVCGIAGAVLELVRVRLQVVQELVAGLDVEIANVEVAVVAHALPGEVGRQEAVLEEEVAGVDCTWAGAGDCA